jgi:hypothetical protein
LTNCSTKREHEEVRLKTVMTKDPITATSNTALVPSLTIMFEQWDAAKNEPKAVSG